MACNNMCWSPATQSAVRVTWKNKSINPNQSPIIHPRPQFSQQRSHQGLSTRFELIPLSFLIRGHERGAASSAQNYHSVFKGKELGGDEGSSLSSFNEKMENCFLSELLGLSETPGSGGDVEPVGISSQSPQGVLGTAVGKLLCQNFLLQLAKPCLQIKCFIGAANYEVYQGWGAAWLSCGTPWKGERGQRDLACHLYGLRVMDSAENVT